MICDDLDIDVWELIGLANRHPRVNILQPGPGVGGHCIAVDPWFIVSRSPETARIIRTAREVNDAKPDWVRAKVDRAVADHLAAHPGLKATDVTIACYGLTFKPDIDDLRESPALEIVAELAASHPGIVLAVEPNIDSLPMALSPARFASETEARATAQVHVMLVDHREFREATAPEGRLIDARGVWS